MDGSNTALREWMICSSFTDFPSQNHAIMFFFSPSSLHFMRPVRERIGTSRCFSFDFLVLAIIASPFIEKERAKTTILGRGTRGA